MRPVAVVAALVAAVLVPVWGAAQTIAIRAGRLVDPDAGTAAANQVVLVEGGRIRAVGAGLAIPAGARVIDLSDATVLPGLFDCHSHLCATIPVRARTMEEMLRQVMSYTSQVPTAARAIQGVANAAAMLQSGFTTVRDVGNAGAYADTALREAIEKGLVPGPTMINAGRIIAPFGGQFRLPPDRPSLGEPEYAFADSADEIRKAVRENVHFGARVIKIVVDDQPYAYSADDIRLVVEEARRSGLKVAAHCVTEAGARNAIEGGVASIEHGFAMTDELLARARAKGVFLVGTDFTADMLEEAGMGAMYPVVVDRLRRAVKAGTPLAFGSDVFTESAARSRGQLAVSLVRTSMEAGVPPRTIVQAMTSNAARLLGLEKERGRIAAGLAADLVAVARNPLDDPRALEDVVFVMKDGRVVRERR